VPSHAVFWMIMSTTTPLSASGANSRAATPAWSGRSPTVILASSRATVTPDTTTCSISRSSGTTQVPSTSEKLDRTWIGTPYFMPSSTERICSTLAPRLASSSISS
jgi:hypothetical protein